MSLHQIADFRIMRAEIDHRQPMACVLLRAALLTCASARWMILSILACIHHRKNESVAYASQNRTHHSGFKNATQGQSTSIVQFFE